MCGVFLGEADLAFRLASSRLCSSIGRAPASKAGRWEFESLHIRVATGWLRAQTGYVNLKSVLHVYAEFDGSHWNLYAQVSGADPIVLWYPEFKVTNQSTARDVVRKILTMNMERVNE